MTDAAQPKKICSSQSITMPSGGDIHLIPPPPKPCVTILVHGVNDLAGCYARIEQGLCEGLNERLDMPRTFPNGANNPGYLLPASYTTPADDDGEAKNPDAVYFRRKAGASSNGCQPRSVVVPFYWGFREEEAFIQKTEAHGQWLDRDGNRLDKAGTKEGGQFANATTNLPDMWGNGFNGMLLGFISLNKIGGTMTHPLFSAAGRRYMVLAAMRLAMLIKIIHKRHPNDTINVVGHSQGTVLTLLAHAFLKEDGAKPADGVVMFNSPYSLFQPNMDKVQKLGGQQTTGARIATLNGILQFIAGSPNPVPALSGVALKNKQGYGAIGGPGWTGTAACQTTIRGEKITFNERDNRGCTFLYFTPQDQTVGLKNVQGIGWQGIGEEVDGQPARKLLPQRFHQRVFTVRKRNGEKEPVGKHVPPYVYLLRQDSEQPWEDTGLGFMDRIPNGSLDKGASVVLTAPQLPVPGDVNFANDGVITAPGEASKSGVYQMKDKLDPVDASIGVANGGWEPKNPRYARQETMEEALAFKYGQDIQSVEKARNEGKEASECAHVFAARAQGNGKVLITRGETPYDARIRLQGEKYSEALSFHSSIPNNPEHSRQVLAYDVAIGAGECVDEGSFYAYLCRVADWRLDWKKTDGGANAQFQAENEDPDDSVDQHYQQEDGKNRELIDSTVAYRKTGTLPAISDNMPSLVATQTRTELRKGEPVRFGGTP
ncbi:T6SS effector phospholipase Tle3 domain-containing protein [Pseudomonas sp. P2757]|uniref:T6SS effector phospholipase Tle3 domain-containing protein n=1 Tax=unclassified Pseudomonas TaxID=196821 RepID=UPI003B5A8457